MDRRTKDAAAIEAGVDQVRSLGIEALRQRWRMMSGAIPPKGLSEGIIARMIAYRIQAEASGGLDKETVKLLDRLTRGGKPDGLNRRLKAGTVLVREYQGERHTVTIVPDGFLWQDSTYTVGMSPMPSSFAASTLPWPAMMPPEPSIKTGLMKPNSLILAAICLTCFGVWVRGLRSRRLS